ncbi:MAG: arginine repressor [Christensenellales bacterium]|jgi:transcriptional regulator of arginine metabolism|nr:arginine repressor [Clostridiales bacterium]
MKNARQSAILSIIEERDVQTQEELARILTELGIRVTQATVSRDIKELRLLKVLSPSGGYKYATADRAEHGISERLVRMFAESVLSIQEVNNLIVIRTLSGSANVAGEAIDNMHWPEILGTISGDNTILVILGTAEEAIEVAERFKESIRVSR